MAKPPLSRLWIFAFFVMGVIIGLLLLVLQRGPVVITPPLQAERVEAPAPSVKATANKPAAKAQPRRDGPQPAVPLVKPPSKVQSLLCDREQAEAVVKRARTLASIRDSADGAVLSLTSGWEYYSPGLKRSFVEAYSEADHCLQGRYRSLRLLYRGEEVATVSADGTIKMK